MLLIDQANAAGSTKGETVMNDILMVGSVVVMFFLRIGIPVIILVGLGIVVDRWQRRRDANIERKYNTPA